MKKIFFGIFSFGLVLLLVSLYFLFHPEKKTISYTVTTQAKTVAKQHITAQDLEKKMDSLNKSFDTIDTLQKQVDDALANPTEAPAE